MFDNAYRSLLEDLHDRGLLENTMVVAMGEFGRTPKVNPAGGRDHWPQCWSILMGGGPLKGGTVVGASDEIGGRAERPADDPGRSRRDDLQGPGHRPRVRNCPARRAGRSRGGSRRGTDFRVSSCSFSSRYESLSVRWRFCHWLCRWSRTDLARRLEFPQRRNARC